MTMLEEIIQAMNQLGGHCYYKDLYARLKENNPNYLNNYTSERNWQASVRATIERNSSDSKTFNGANIFYSVEGLGGGHWGLVKPDLSSINVDLSADDESFPEGKKVLRKHLIRERNPYLKMKAIAKFKKEHNGNVFCEICGFDFHKKYGDLGKDFIEMHHLKPVSQMQDKDETKMEDIILVCSNCHSMIHRKRPWLLKDEIKEIIKN